MMKKAAPVPYDLVIREHAKYLHAKVVGERTAENTLRFLKDVYAACVKTGLRDVLLEMRFSGRPLDSASIFNVIADRSPDGARLGKIAYVEATMNDKAKARFAETVAVNRAVNVRLFDDVAAAARWLNAGKDG